MEAVGNIARNKPYQMRKSKDNWNRAKYTDIGYLKVLALAMLIALLPLLLGELF